jgi:hypothetical protein
VERPLRLPSSSVPCMSISMYQPGLSRVDILTPHSCSQSPLQCSEYHEEIATIGSLPSRSPGSTSKLPILCWPRRAVRKVDVRRGNPLAGCSIVVRRSSHIDSLDLAPGRGIVRIRLRFPLRVMRNIPIFGFGVQVPGGAPVLTWAFSIVPRVPGVRFGVISRPWVLGGCSDVMILPTGPRPIPPAAPTLSDSRRSGTACRQDLNP